MAGYTSGRSAWMLAAPAVLLMVMMVVLPILVVVAMSFSNYSLGASDPNWVGFSNYETLFSRSSYAKMFTATFTYVVIVVAGSVSLGLGAALLVNSVTRFGALYKTVYFLPVMAALLAMAIVWEFTLHPTLGFVNRTLELACGTGAESLPFFAEGCARGFPLWLNDREYAIYTVAFIGIWQGFGFNMVLYLAGLTAVSAQLYQAAQMDGASSAWQRFRLVTWPALGPTTVFVVTISCIRSFQVFDTVEAFYPQGGGPSKSVYVMLFAIYEKAIQQNLVGIGAAITVLFLILVMGLTVLQRRVLDKRVHYG